jgi:hypothetical protein
LAPVNDYNVNRTENAIYESIACICGIEADDGNAVECGTCKRWAHAVCYYPQHDKKLIAELQHTCIRCRPDQSVDFAAAQLRQRERLFRDAKTNDHTIHPRYSASTSEVTNEYTRLYGFPSNPVIDGWNLHSSKGQIFSPSLNSIVRYSPTASENQPLDPGMLSRQSALAYPFSQRSTERLYGFSYSPTGSDNADAGSITSERVLEIGTSPSDQAAIQQLDSYFNDPA